MFWDQESDAGIEMLPYCHSSHVIWNETCIHCGRSNSIVNGLSYECPNEPDQHRIARLFEASDEFLKSTEQT